MTMSKFELRIFRSCLLFVLVGCQSLAIADTAWDTQWSERGHVSLEQGFDSSGPDAWSSADHPNVFITSEGPGYGGLMSGVTLPGLAIIDADTREVVGSQSYDVFDWGWKNVFEPHGLGVSPDGQWIYLPTGEGSFATKGEHAGRFLVINARTLKVDKVIRIPGQAHHAKSYVTPEGEPRVMLYAFHGELIVLDPSDDNRVVGGVFADTIQGEKYPYLYFMSPDSDELLGATAFYPADRSLGAEQSSNLYFFDPVTWQLTETKTIGSATLTWMAFSSDNKSAFISSSHDNAVYKLNRENNEFTARIGASVTGPYGVHLGWDDDLLYTIGKGEHSHNRGKMLGLVSGAKMDAKSLGPRNPFSAPLDEFYTGCIRGDHGTLHPDPEVNELWISCNASFEVVVFDLDRREVTERIPLPNGGSTHSGAFVSYSADWEGEVVSDHNGLHGSALALKREILSDE